MSYKTIIENAAQQALGIDMDSIPDDIRDMGLSLVSTEGKAIWDGWPWDNTKVTVDSLTPDTDGIITFASTVDAIRAVRPTPTNADAIISPVYNEDEILAIVQGKSINPGRFQNMADDSSGNRRIRVVVADSDSGTWTVLALLRFVEPTLLNYDTLDFPIDRARGALLEFVKDGFREFLGRSVVGKGGRLLSTALDRETRQQDKENKVQPRHPSNRESGNWW